MDSRRALRCFWGTHVPGALDHHTWSIEHALILMGDWCVSDAESTPIPKKTQVRIRFLVAEGEELKKESRTRKRGVVCLLDKAC